MKYYEVAFTISPCSQDACDILSAMAGEAGFETFEETTEGMTGYVQQALFDQPALDAVISSFPLPDIHITYHIREAEDKDWNEQWEQEGFEPIEVRCEMEDDSEYQSSDGEYQSSGRCKTLVIHDGRHLPSDISLQPSDIMIEIDAHLAFGTGTHETTRMICATLLNSQLSIINCQLSIVNSSSIFHVLDCGCGTGILSICALKLGATHCTAYDIDEWSVDNTRHNAVINLVDDRLTVMHGDATVLDGIAAKFHLVMANINRNILLQDMPRFVSVMNDGATLILSGFYRSDCQQLEQKAASLGLTLQETRYDGDWACMVFIYAPS
jgi:ribosomal protein L11 methyltransferase